MRDVLILFCIAFLSWRVSRFSRSLMRLRQAIVIQNETIHLMGEVERLKRTPTSLTTVVAAEDSHELN